MKPVKVTKEELLAIFCAGGRNSGERSHALPQECYGDPAKTVKYEREKAKPKNRGWKK